MEASLRIRRLALAQKLSCAYHLNEGQTAMDKSLRIVDGDEMLRAQLSRSLASRGDLVTMASKFEEARDRIGAWRSHAVVDLIFAPNLGGDRVLYQYFFWFYSHLAI